MTELVTKYQQYEEYKDFDSVFLNEIPASWEVKPLYTLCEFRQGKAHEPFIDDDGEFICVSARFVSTQGKSFKRCKVNLTPAKLNDILMVMSDLPNGRALARAFFIDDKIKYAVNQRVGVVTAKKVHAKFLYYQLNRNAYFLMFDDGSNQTNLSNDAFNKYPVLFPSDFEQKQIANFLDYETAQIDTLIDKQQTLIQLLKEKRQAVISHAVTKGLNPDAPMKDSGVEWLGEVPEHWVVSPLKLYIDTRKGVAFKSADFTDLGVRVVKASDIKEKTIRQSDVFLPVYFSETYPKAILSEGDIVISTVGSTPDVKNSAVGQIGMVPVELDGSLLNQNTVVFTPRNNILENLFLFYLIQTDVYRDHLDLNAHGTANQASLNVSDMLNFTFARPSFKEQSEISEHIIKVNNSFDALEKNCVTAIQLMQERRTALISAAVTGKIDVRGWRAPE